MVAGGRGRGHWVVGWGRGEPGAGSGAGLRGAGWRRGRGSLEGALGGGWFRGLCRRGPGLGAWRRALGWRALGGGVESGGVARETASHRLNIVVDVGIIGRAFPVVGCAAMTQDALVQLSSSPGPPLAPSEAGRLK